MPSWYALAMRRLVLVFATLALAGACKGDAQKCEAAARNYATLTYWEKTDAEIAKLPASQRSLAHKKAVSAFTNALESGIDARIQQCVSANNEDQVDCMIAAKTAEQVAKCADPAPNNKK